MFSMMVKDKKTFELLKKYIIFLEYSKKECISLDNKIEHDEICDYMLSNGYNNHDNIEIIDWIKNNGKSFRDYLNTIKLIYIIWHCNDTCFDSISWEEFCVLSDRLNETMDSCLETIY